MITNQLLYQLSYSGNNMKVRSIGSLTPYNRPYSHQSKLSPCGLDVYGIQQVQTSPQNLTIASFITGYYHRPFSFTDVIPFLVMGVRPRPLAAINGTSLYLVGDAGFEPAALWSQTRCATRLRQSPLLIHSHSIHSINLRKVHTHQPTQRVFDQIQVPKRSGKVIFPVVF